METSTKSCEAELLQTLRKNSTFQFRIILRHFFQPSVRLSKTLHHRIHESCCSCTVSWLQPGRHQDSVTGHDPPAGMKMDKWVCHRNSKNFTKWLLAVTHVYGLLLLLFLLLICRYAYTLPSYNTVGCTGSWLPVFTLADADYPVWEAS